MSEVYELVLMALFLSVGFVLVSCSLILFSLLNVSIWSYDLSIAIYRVKKKTKKIDN